MLGKTEIHAGEPFIPEYSSFKVEIAFEKLKMLIKFNVYVDQICFSLEYDMRKVQKNKEELELNGTHHLMCKYSCVLLYVM
jgi:hypothetical protein